MSPITVVLSIAGVVALISAVRAVLLIRRREAQRRAALARLRPDE